MKIKCIIFDVDGVIVTGARFSQQYTKKYNISFDEMLPFFAGKFRDSTIGKADLKEILNGWPSKWNFDGDVDELIEYWLVCSSKKDKRVIDIVNNLEKKGIKSFVATNQEKYRTEYMKNQMGFNKIFSGVFSSCYIGCRKPQREYYEYVLNTIKNDYNINPDEILFIDDSQDNVIMAENFCMKGYLYENYEKFDSFIKLI